MSVADTVWELEAHTAAKHAILRNYINAWLPIMSTWNGRIIVLDGFAGPGKYARGEPGSPLIVLDAALGHKQPIKAQVSFIFIEARPDRCQHLRSLLDTDYKPRLPRNLAYTVRNAKFDETLTEILDYLEEKQSLLAPTFAFIDPFGYSDTPFDLIRRLMQHSRCEVFINFNFEEVNRFLKVESQWPHFDRQFGTRLWRDALKIDNPDQRQQYLHDLYKTQLEGPAGIKYARSFQMVNQGNRTDYFLFFGTQGYEGLRQMKHAMWRVDPSGAYRFSDRRNFQQPYLIDPVPDYALLETLIVGRFRGKGSFNVQDLARFVIEDTPFLDTHYKTKILLPMEKAGELSVVASPRKRPLSYPDGTRLLIPG